MERVRRKVVGWSDMWEEEEEGVLGYYDVVPLLLLILLGLDQNS